MSRFLRKAYGALKNPLRAVKIILREGWHMLYVPIRYGTRRTCTFSIRGVSFSFDTTDRYSKQWFFPRCDKGRYHEPAVTELVARLSTNAPSFIDVGAHLGYFTVLAGALMPEKPVVAYEIDERAFERLETNIAHNKLTNVRVVHGAIAKESGPVRYRHLPILDSGESLSYENSDDPSKTVAGLTLDDALESMRVIPGIIKIDVEGAEQDILAGMKRTLEKHPILLLEIHGRKLPLFGSDSQKVLRFLAEYGYKTYEIVEHRSAGTPTLKLLSPSAPPFTQNTMTLVVHEDSEQDVLARINSAEDTEEETRNHFNEAAKGRISETYEGDRWKIDPRVAAQYECAKAFILEQVVPMVVGKTHVMELGPGPGTWTKYLYEANSKTTFVLLDISREMLARAVTVFPSSAQVETREGDFLSVPLKEGEADFFFSSRAIEYVTDKAKAVARIHSALVSGGEGCIITKMPKKLANLASGRAPGKLHKGQIAPGTLKDLLAAEGFTAIYLYPVTFGVPLLRSASADRFVSVLFHRTKLNWLSGFFAESYAVTFRKS